MIHGLNVDAATEYDIIYLSAWEELEKALEG